MGLKGKKTYLHLLCLIKLTFIGTEFKTSPYARSSSQTIHTLVFDLSGSISAGSLSMILHLPLRVTLLHAKLDFFCWMWCLHGPGVESHSGSPWKLVLLSPNLSRSPQRWRPEALGSKVCLPTLSESANAGLWMASITGEQCLPVGTISCLGKSHSTCALQGFLMTDGSK